MTRLFHIFSGTILLALVLMVTIVSAAHAQVANLSVSKGVSPGTFEIGDKVTWVVTVRNDGPADAHNIILEEDLTQLAVFDTVTVTADPGTVYNTATNTWTIPKLVNAASASLTLVTNFSTAGTKINRVTITDLDEDDKDLTDNHAANSVIINTAAPVVHDVALKIKPTTLNLKSKGVFTVFVTVGGLSSDSADDEESADDVESGDNDDGAAKPDIDFANSSLTCGEAGLIRASVSNKDGGTLIAKFYRQDLMNVTNGDGVRVNCSGTISVEGKTYTVEGSDTIRVIGDKKGLAKILSDVKKFLRLEKDESEVNETDDGNVTTFVTLNADSLKNKGQIKKNNQISSDITGTNTDNSQSDKTRGPREKVVKTSGNNNNLRENSAGNTTGKGNNNGNKPDDKSYGKSNGKKNT